MTKYLVRAGKHPFEPISAPETHGRNIIGTNNGNRLFQESVIKTLSVSGADITPTHYRVNPADAKSISDNYDAYILPLANAFRPSFMPKLDRLTELVEGLKIPTVVVGVGIQTDLEYNLDQLSGMDSSVKRFVSAVLDRSARIGVRGEATANYLNRLGFTDVDIIGCPSMFTDGSNFSFRTPSGSLTRDSRIGLSLSSTGTQAAFSDSLSAMGKVFEHNVALYKNAYYLPQEGRSLEELVWNSKPKGHEHDSIREGLFEELRESDRVRFFVDPREWFRFGSTLDFAFGTRLHGAIAILLGGTPAHLIAHDSRTRELAEYFQIPFTRITEMALTTTAEDLYARSDYSAMLSGHQERFDRYSAFMAANDLPNSFVSGEAQAFASTLEAAALAPEVTGLPTVALANDKSDYLYKIEKLRKLKEAKAKEAAAARPKNAQRGPVERLARKVYRTIFH